MATKKTVTKTPAKKAAAKPAAKVSKPKAVTTVLTKSQLIAHLAEASGVEPKAVKAVFASLETTILSAVSKKGAGTFVLPGLLKLVTQSVPAKKAREGKDPFTGEIRKFAAKPASVRVRIRALKKVKTAAL